MDVREWLEATADRAPPDASTDPSIQDTAPHDARQPQRLSHRYRRKKKEADGESYILVPDRRKGRPPTTPSLRTPSPRRPRHAQVAESGSRCSSRSRSPDSDAPRERAHQYERRPRRKTRPDRYDHKPKKRQEERKSRRDQAPKRRKSNRTHDGSRTTGLVQSFQLKNGPKNNRLTLRGDANVGLFKHGRASAQVSGKGIGLPDLAFNELRFLQRPTEHQDESHDSQVPRQFKKNERKRHLDEEISAFFTAHKQAPKEDSDRQKLPSEKRRFVASQDQSTRQQELHSPRDIVNLTDKPILGLEGKPTAHGREELQSDATTYLPWSESVTRQVSDTRAPCENGTLPGRAHRPSVSQHDRISTGKPASRGVRARRAARGDNTSGIEQSQWVGSQRINRPALVEVYQDPRISKPTRQVKKTYTTQSTSASLSRLPVPVHEERERQASPEDVGAQDNHAYRTSDILKVTWDRLSNSPGERRSRKRCLMPFSDKENDDPESSFSLDKLLEDLQKVKAMPAVMIEPPSEMSHKPRHLDEKHAEVNPGHEKLTESSGLRGQLPHVQQWRPPLGSSGMLQQAQARPSTSVAKSNFRPEAEAEMNIWNHIRHTGYTPAFDAALARSHFSPLSEVDEMRDVLIDDDPDFAYIHGTEQVLSDFPYPGAHAARADTFREQAIQPEQDQSLPWSGGWCGASEYEQMATSRYVDDKHEDMGIEQVSEQDEELAGFWKPQRLQ